MDSSTLKTRLETATMSFKNLELQLADPDVASDPKRLENIARERARLEPLVLDYQELQNVENELVEKRHYTSTNRWIPIKDIKNGYVINSRHTRLISDASALDLIEF